MAKKKNKQVIRPWCWYCEREFEDEKVLMQHQKAKHFKCNMCPRRLNTAGGLAVHIQQVHKLEPDNLPRIENALPGRDGYEVEIFGMEGIPAPDVADYKRRKEIELGLAAGSISQPPAKRPKTENRMMSEEELKAALEAHKALMGGANDSSTSSAPDQAIGAVYGAPPQAYAAPPTPSPAMPVPPPGMMPGAPPFFPPPSGLVPGQPPFPPFPGMPGPPPPGFAIPPGFPPPPGMMPPGASPPGPPGMLPPGVSPPPGALGIPGAPAPPGALIPGAPGAPVRPPMPPPPTFIPQQQGSSASPPLPPSASGSSSINGSVTTPPPPSSSAAPTPVTAAETSLRPTLPDPSLQQTNPAFKKPTELKYQDANFSPEEIRAYSHKYRYRPSEQASAPNEESRGKKRARAEDFM
ncbi:hypothetical protein GYMLUDRAFT_41472 [Collybiopsis luxurians FD-317 M1]|uniref:C2H2-type domain-containing protein n=1 Tax=Collybiopsis luxurians FD-317 M1 TaxID=944289 RepID=A0A0D0CUF5_9AGAR|nr:hypothetical protein GYMLUDRAFT_41472 [Collybiopsis luxurians FD-317 M1]